MEEVRKIEGSGYCCPTTGFFDGLFNFLQKSLTYVKLKNVNFLLKFLVKNYKRYKKIE